MKDESLLHVKASQLERRDAEERVIRASKYVLLARVGSYGGLLTTVRSNGLPLQLQRLFAHPHHPFWDEYQAVVGAMRNDADSVTNDG